MGIDQSNDMPAFPVSTIDPFNGHQTGLHEWQFPGMTVRDYFAAKAMAAVMIMDGIPYADRVDQHAVQAYAQADAMLRARAPGSDMEGL